MTCQQTQAANNAINAADDMTDELEALWTEVCYHWADCPNCRERNKLIERRVIVFVDHAKLFKAKGMP